MADNSKQRKKQKLNEVREMDTNQSFTINQNVIDVNRYIQARLDEIKALDTSIMKTLNSDSIGKQPFQLLPRYLRRRAASHQPNRLVGHLRRLRKINGPASDEKLRKSVQSRRKRRKLGLNPKWLKTHIWHAKRFKMKDLYGFRLAYQLKEKCRRGILKNALYKCTLYDASYYQLYELVEMSVDEYQQRLKSILHPFINLDLSNDFLQQQFIYLENRFPFGFLCPVDYFYFNQKLYFSIHSQFSKQFECLLKSIGISFTHLEKWTRFELLGSRSVDVLKTALNFKEDFYQKLSCHQHQLPPFLHTRMCQDPRLFPVPLLPKRQKLQTEFPVNYSKAEDLKFINVEALTESEMFAYKKHKKEIPAGKSLEFPLWLLHSVRTNTLTNKWVMLLPPSFANIVWRALIHSGARATGIKEEKMFKFEANSLYYPSDYPDHVLKQEENENEEEEEKWTSYYRKPPAKRINFEKLGFKSPFTPDFDSLFSEKEDDKEEIVEKEPVNDLSNLKEKSFWVMRGFVMFQAFQKSLKKENYNHFEQSLQISLEKCLVPVLIESVEKGLFTKAALLYDLLFAEYSLYDKHAQHPTFHSFPSLQYPDYQPPIIGTVTTGDYSLLTGHSKAIGFVKAKSLFEIIIRNRKEKRKIDNLFLARDTKTNQYRFVRLILFNSTE